MDTFARVGAGWFVTCVVGGLAVIAAGILVPSDYGLVPGLLIVSGGLAVGIGIFGIVAEIFVARQGRANRPSQTLAADNGSIAIQGHGNTVMISQPTVQGLVNAEPDLESVLTIEKAESHLGHGGDDPSRLGLGVHATARISNCQVRLRQVRWTPTNGSPQDIEILPGPLEWDPGINQVTLPAGAHRMLWLVFVRDDGPWLPLAIPKSVPNSGRYSLSLAIEADGYDVRHATYEFDFMRVDRNVSTWSWV